MGKKNEELLNKANEILESKALNEDGFPNEYPFWARLKIDKRRSTLVIDRDMAMDKKKKKLVPGFVHREVTSQYKKDREKIEPNPDPKKTEPMYLKGPKKTPKNLIKHHDGNFNMPDELKERYSKNNKK